MNCFICEKEIERGSAVIEVPCEDGNALAHEECVKEHNERIIEEAQDGKTDRRAIG